MTLFLARIEVYDAIKKAYAEYYVTYVYDQVYEL